MPAGHTFNCQPRARECIADRGMQGFGVADLKDCLQRSGQVTAVVMQHRRACTQLRLARRRLGVGAKVIVKAPATDRLAQLQHLGRGLQAANLIEQAVVQRRVLCQHLPVAPVTRADHGAVALDQLAGRPIKRPRPDAFVLDLRIEVELRAAGYRQAQGDGVAEVFPGKAKTQAPGFLAHAGMHIDFTRFHASGDHLRPGPESRTQPAFTRQCIHHAALGGFGQ